MSSLSTHCCWRSPPHPSTGAFAQAWPSKPIRLIVPFPPAAARTSLPAKSSQKVATATGWTFVIENKPGAGGNLGVDAAAKSPPDGYTLVLGQTSNLAINPTLYAKLPYDPQKDLAPIVLVANAPLVMVPASHRPSRRWPSGDGRQGQARGHQLRLAGQRHRGAPDSELFQKAAGVKLQHVPYKGAAQALTDVIERPGRAVHVVGAHAARPDQAGQAARRSR